MIGGGATKNAFSSISKPIMVQEMNTSEERNPDEEIEESIIEEDIPGQNGRDEEEDKAWQPNSPLITSKTKMKAKANLFMMKPPKPTHHRQGSKEEQNNSIIEENIPSGESPGTPLRDHHQLNQFHQQESRNEGAGLEEGVDDTFAEIINKYSVQQQNPFSLATRRHQSSSKVLVPANANTGGVPIFKKQVSGGTISNPSNTQNSMPTNFMGERRPFSPPIKNVQQAPAEDQNLEVSMIN